MDLRKRRKHSIDKLPIGTIRWRRVKRPNGSRFKVCVIKISNQGRAGQKWCNYARWVWMQHHRRPVPSGMRVIQKDGNLKNFAIDNLVLGTAADALWIFCHRDPVKSAANHLAKAEGCRRRNRERAAVHRAMHRLKEAWYAVDLGARRIINRPARERYQAAGCPRMINGSGWIGWRLGWPDLASADACLLAALLRRDTARLSRLVDAVEELRAGLMISPTRVNACTLASAAVRLKRLGLIERVERGCYRATDLARDRRGPVCPFAFVRGAVLSDERFVGFEVVD